MASDTIVTSSSTISRDGVLWLRGGDESLTVAPISDVNGSAIGAEIEGVDWSRELPEALVQEVSAVQLLADHIDPRCSSFASKTSTLF